MDNLTLRSWLNSVYAVALEMKMRGGNPFTKAKEELDVALLPPEVSKKKQNQMAMAALAGMLPPRAR